MTFADLTKLAPRTLLLAALSLAMFHAPGVFGQQSGKIAFQAASVHSSDSEARCAPNAAVGQTFTVKNCELGALILFAYDVLQQQVSGETSVLGEKYDVTAKADHPVSRSEMKRMLQTLLEDRFKLTLRHEMKETSVYALVIAEGGPKFHLNPAASEEGPKPVQGSGGQLVFQNMAMSDLVFALSRRISDRIVVDKTGLTGKYDVDMTWYLELGKPNPPSVFNAVHVLGLNLEPQKGPLEFLVIDHCERPSEKKRWLKEAARFPQIPLPFHMSDCVAGSKRFAPFDEETRLEMQKRMIATLKGLDIQAYGSSLVRVTT